MTKKLSFDRLPEAVGKILEILTAEGSEHSALPEIVQRIALIEKKIDHLEKSISPDRAAMDKHTVLKVLKMRPRMLNELEMSGVLPSYTEGRRTLFYESDVVKFYMTQPAWKAALESKPEREKADTATSPEAAEPVAAEGRQRVDINGASEILGRTTGAIRQLLSTGLPYHKDGRWLYFYSDELREWGANHKPRKKRKHNETE
ncbi:MAG: hypothetical protein LBU98_01050 [Alistipes sp.]|nr:hypothetical protein [Alistipes sp.]